MDSCQAKIAAMTGPDRRKVTGSGESWPEDCPLELECEEDVLSPAQLAHYTSPSPTFSQTMARLGDLAQGRPYRRLTTTTNSHRPPARRPGPPSQPPTKSPKLVDLTTPGPDPVGAQSVKKSFPALWVVAKVQQVPTPNRRTELDSRVKGLLGHSPAKFTEWLIEQGLVRTEQYEEGVKLKLGMYSDGKRFPNSGGYVWIQEQAAGSTQYTNVYRGSLFEDIISSGRPPTVLLKLFYHWACQTNIADVVQWVKIDHRQVAASFRQVRAVCVAAVQSDVVGLGGAGSEVEVGVISLGTTAPGGTQRQVRVEVLGLLDRQSGRIRLRATEPVPGASQVAHTCRVMLW